MQLQLLRILLNLRNAELKAIARFQINAAICSFRNVSYDEELKYKRTRVNDALERIGKLDIEVEEIIGADCTQNYRNKAQYPVSICDGELLPVFTLIKAIELYVVMIASFSRLSLKQGLMHLGFGQKKPILHRMMKIQAKVCFAIYISGKVLQPAILWLVLL